MRFPTFLAVILFVLVVIIGCGSGTCTEPITTDEVRVAGKERLEISRSFGTDQQIVNEETPAPGSVTPTINWTVCLRGYWLAEYTVEAFSVEVLFIIREDSTFSSSAALNGSKVTEWDHGIWKFDSDLLRISFQTNNVPPDWNVAVYFGDYFTCFDHSFYRTDGLPEWATY